MKEVARFSRPETSSRREANGAGDLLARLNGGPLVIRSAREMGALLLASSPGQAWRFALDSHERACERAEDDVTAFWLETLHWLFTHKTGVAA